MAYSVRHFGHFKLFTAAVLAFALVTPKPVEASSASSDKICRSVAIAASLFIVGSTLWYSLTASLPGAYDDEEQILQLPVIAYKKEAKLKNRSIGDIRLAPTIDPKGKMLELTGTRSQLKAQIEAAICDPIPKVKGVNRTYLKDIHNQCHAWFRKNNMVFPHEISGIDLTEAFNVVLPELVYKANTLTLSPYQVSLKPSQKTATKEVMSYYSIVMSDFQPNEYFKTCYHYPQYSGMNPPMMDMKGELVFKLPKRGVTHLHHDGHAEYFIATDLYHTPTRAYAWKLGAPWPPVPTPVKLTTTSSELLPVHLLDHE